MLKLMIADILAEERKEKKKKTTFKQPCGMMLPGCTLCHVRQTITPTQLVQPGPGRTRTRRPPAQKKKK